MKYSTGRLKQSGLLHYNLDTKDGWICLYLLDLFQSRHKKIVAVRRYDELGKGHTWVNFKTACEEMPIIKMGERALRTRFKYYREHDILSFITHKHYLIQEQKFFFHDIYYYRFTTEAYRHLFTTPNK